MPGEPLPRCWISRCCGCRRCAPALSAVFRSDDCHRTGRDRHHFHDALCDPCQANRFPGAGFRAAAAADDARQHYRRFSDLTIVIALVAIGTISMTLYVIHARRTASPVLDFALLRLPTMRASIIGGFLSRLGIGSLPFLLPLLMQVGFGLSPLRSGLVTFASAVGAMGMKTLAARVIRTFGFRNIMTINAVVSSIFLAACALFTIATPLLLIMIILVVGGFFRSLQFTAINTLAYAEVEPAQMSRATTLVSVNQQLAVSAGVAVGAFSVESTMLLHHVSELSAADFAPAFIVVSVISAISAYFFYEMPADAGHQVSGRGVLAVAPERDAEPEETAAAETANARDQRLG